MRYVILTVGHSGSCWVAKMLNSHREVFCSHEALYQTIYPERWRLCDIEKNRRAELALIDYLTFGTAIKGCYKAYGDVGSLYLPESWDYARKKGLKVAMLIRHPIFIAQSQLICSRNIGEFTVDWTYYDRVWKLKFVEYVQKELNKDELELICTLLRWKEIVLIEFPKFKIEDLSSSIDYFKTFFEYVTGIHLSCQETEALLIKEKVNSHRKDNCSTVEDIFNGWSDNVQELYVKHIANLAEKFTYRLNAAFLKPYVLCYRGRRNLNKQASIIEEEKSTGKGNGETKRERMKSTLSFVVTARNDNHGGNMLHRMQVFVNALCYQCKKYNIDAELIIVEWNPPQNKKRISQVIDWPNELSPLTVRFIEVPPEIHDQIGNADKIPLFQMIAKNVGIRRAKGEFVLATNIDLIFSDELMWFLSRSLLDENSFYRICRYDVGSRIIPTDIGAEEQLEFCRSNLVRIQGLNGTKDLNKIETESEFNQRRDEFIRLSDDGIRTFLEKKGKEDKLFTNACGDFTLMSRNKWFSLKCHPELPKWSIYVDGLLLHMAYVSRLSQIILPDPMRIYHIEHQMGWAVIQDTVKERPSLDYQKEYIPWCQKMLREKRPVNPNDENWGLAQYDLKEYAVSEPLTQTEKMGESDADIRTLDVFHEWIARLATAQNRLYYRDQTPESLNDLVELVDKYKPTKIVELGTLSGLSLRTWLSADTNAEIVAIDLSFVPLRQSQQILPVDLSRVKLLEQDILKTDFSRLWGPEDRVLLYIDAHDQPNVPIMDYVLRNAVLVLPSGSMVVVDDLWHSPATLSSKTALQFFKNTVINEIDPLQCFQGYYAPYWKGGSFFGFREVIPLMEWVNRNRIDLVFKSGVKSVAFEWPQKNSVEAEFHAEAFEQLTGKVSYNPVEKSSFSGDENLPVNRQAIDLCKKGSQLYASGNLNEAMNCFQQASHLSHSLSGVFYAQAVILARAGQLEAPTKILEEELKSPSPHSNAHALLKDIRSWTNKRQNSKQELSQKEQAQAITIFTMPKPFKGHINIIQRNAIKSWTLLKPRPEIILLGDDEGTAEIAKEFGLRHIPHVERNEFGTPLLNSMFAVAEANSSNSILAYVNADIILMNDFAEAIETILKKGLNKFLMVGQRWDIELRDLIDFKNHKWEDKLKSLVSDGGTLHAATGVDYFVFSKGAWGNIPPFALGRTAWDNWLIQRALNLKMHVIDATQAAIIIHQNHDYGHIRGGKQEAWNGEEAKANVALAGGYDNIKSIAYARWIINKDGKLIKKVPALNKRGEELFNKGDIAGALTAFTKAIEIDPSFATAYNNLGVLYWQNGEAQKAINNFKKALEIAPDDRDAIFNYGSVLTSLEKFEDAKNLYSSYLQKNPNDKQISRFLSSLEEKVKTKETEKCTHYNPWNSETIFRNAKVEDCLPNEKSEVTTELASQSSWSSWLPPKDELEKLIIEFLKLYALRPIQNNDGGVKSVGAFSLWFFLRRINPNLVIESGVWKGLTTWLIESSLPDANIICLDPHPEVRQYTSKKAIYPSMDFADMDFGNENLSNALVFFDDHQNAYKRVLQAWEKGFKHLIFDDNYPGENGSHLTLQSCLSLWKNEATHLQEIIEKYEIFPPLYQYDKPITAEKVLIDIPALNITYTPAFEILKQEMCTYRWMTYIKLAKHLQMERVSQLFPPPSGKDVLVNEKDSKVVSEATQNHAKKVSFKYPSMNALLCFLSHREAYRSIMLSTEEIFCSPDCKTTMVGDQYRTINTPAGVYDINSIVEKLTESQSPHLLVVKADATARNFPVNLKTLKCSKLLILGNTQHLKTPIQSLLKYALQEHFDFIMTDHKRHHLHYFKEAGFDKVFWLPGFNNYPHEQPCYDDKLYKVSFVGQAGRWHPYRKHVLQYLKAHSIPVNHFQVPQAEATEIYAQSLINLNISLNGDLNLRVFEVLSSGGFLLTDRLSEESGLNLLFRDGEHLVCFENEKDLLDKIKYFLEHPEEAKAIAQNGYQEFKRNHTPEKKIKELMDVIFSGKQNPLYDIRKEKRSMYVKSDSSTELLPRVALYEFFQEVYLTDKEALILFWPKVDARLACDVIDLPRLRLCIKNDGDEIPDKSLRLFQDTGVSERIKFIAMEELKEINGSWSAAVLTASELLSTGLEDILNSLDFKWLVITDGLDSLNQDQALKLKEALTVYGFEKASEEIEAYYWKDKSLWGEILFSENRIAEAVRCFEHVLSEEPSHLNALNNLGVISYQLGNLEAAEKLLLRAAGLNRRDFNTLINLSHVYFKMERFNDAAKLFQEAALLDSNNPSLWFHLGFCYEQLNKISESIQAYKRCNDLDDDEWSVEEKIESLEKQMPAKSLKGIARQILPPQKILVINNLYPPQELGGYGRVICDFANILRNRGHSIYVLTSNNPYLGEIKQNESNVDRSLVLFGSWHNGVCKSIDNKEKIAQIINKNHHKLQRIIRDISPDLCLLGNIDFLSHRIIQPLLENKIPVIHHLGSPTPGYFVQDAPQSDFYHLATASRWVKEEIIRQGYHLGKISVVYPGALVNEFKMSIPPAVDKLRIAYASIVLPYKGPHILVNALKKLHDAGIDFSCSLAGTTTDENFANKLKNFVIAAGMEEKVHFIGFLPREELKDFFARHNVLAFPSVFEEPFGISQVEAMAAGLLVVTSGTGGAGEIIEHGTSGVIFKSEDDTSLAQELLQLVQDINRWQRIAVTGQERAMKYFDIEKSVDIMEKLYCSLLK